MNDDIGHLIKIVDEQLKKRFDKDLQKFDLTLSQMRVLWFLKSKGGRTSQKDIEDFLQVSHPTVVGLISRLKEKKFVEITTNPEDHRSRIISATPKAEVFYKDSDRRKMLSENLICNNLTPEDVVELKRMLLIICSNLKDSEDIFLDNSINLKEGGYISECNQNTR